MESHGAIGYNAPVHLFLRSRLAVSAALLMLFCAAGGRAQSASGAADAGVSNAEAGAEAATESQAESATESESGAVPPEPAAFPQGSLPDGTQKRSAPDFDGREDEPTTFGDVALWVPRVAFFPVYLVSEYLLRQPLGAVVTAAEQGNWLALLTDFFTFDKEQKVGLVPTAYLEFDFEPSVGAYFFADDAFADGNDLRIHGALWPDDWWVLTVVDRLNNAADTRRLSLRGNLTIRPDYKFHGLGPETLKRDEVRYSAKTYEASVAFDGWPWRASWAHWELGVRRREFDPDSNFHPPSLRQAIEDPDDAIDELPPGFEGYSVFRSGLQLALDTRLPFPAPGHGIRLEAYGEHAFDLESPEARRFVRYGGAAVGFVDLLNQRVVSLALTLDFADPLEGEVPFTELVDLGGQSRMWGFQEGRLSDRSAAVAQIEYRWPVWIWLDFAFHYALGNVFGPQLEDFDPSLLRSSFGFGLKTARERKPDHSINFLLAFGTETIGQGHHIDTIRLAVGGRSGL